MRSTLVETWRGVGLSLTANMENSVEEGSSTGPSSIPLASSGEPSVSGRSASNGRSAAKGTGLLPEAQGKLEPLEAVR